MAQTPSNHNADTKAHAVTGAFGFTGSYLARRLIAAGERVVTLTNSPNRPSPLQGKVEARRLAFDDPKALAESLKDVRVLYNTYWVRFNHKDFSHTEAVRNTLILFEAAKKAGVQRVVHVSITNADPASPLEYFSAKAHLEQALGDFGLSHAIVRPAVIFGDEGILINNIAWALRRFPVFCIFGDGEYRLCPIFVDDLAAILAEQGGRSENTLINALGPEEYSYRELVSMIAGAIGVRRRLVSLPPRLAWRAARLISALVDDTFVTWEEVEGLMAGALHVPGGSPVGDTRLSQWALAHRDSLGRTYQGELDRRRDRNMAYTASAKDTL